MRSYRSRLPFVLLAASLVAACGDGGMGGSGSITLTITTSGDSLDTDGYEVRVDGESLGQVSSNGSFTFTGVPGGNRELSLSGVRANCRVGGGQTQAIHVPNDGVLELTLAVNCLFQLHNVLLFTSDGYFCSTTEPQVRHIRAVDLATGQARSLGIVAQSIGVSPDGTELVVDDGLQSLTRMYADGSNPRVIVGGPQGGGSDSEWSPDGGRLVFRSHRAPDGTGEPQLAISNADGSGIQRVTDNVLQFSGGYGPSWSPDGRWILMSALSRVWRFDLAARRLQFLADGWDAKLSPDGRRIAIAVVPLSTAPDTLVVMNTDGTDRRALVDGVYFGALTWSPDGSRIIFADDKTLKAVDANVGGPPVTIYTHAVNVFFPYWVP